MDQNPLRELNRLGQSVWHDYIRRGELLSGGLKRLIDEDGLTGVTSNPSIFEKAIAGSTDYDDAIRRMAQQGLTAAQIYERLVVEDIQMAADLFRPIYDATQGRDGFVSIEVSPLLAHDTEGTIAEVRRLHRAVNRQNVMVKIPGTREGLPAIEQMLAEGININITLLFAVERYLEVAKAYQTALEKRAREGKAVDRIASVASFFVSRIDTLVDQQLEAKLATANTEGKKHIAQLLGKAAVANAKMAYEAYRKMFLGAGFKALEDRGARVQRLLWASTSTKNPKYSDILYVQDLIGPDTVNTMPPATISAYRDHGKPRLTLEEGLPEARKSLEQLAQFGVDFAAVTQKLEDDGCEAFSRDYNKLLAVIEEKRKKILAGELDTSRATLGNLDSAVQATLLRLDREKWPRRLWDRDPALWKSDPGSQKLIRNALGWLSLPEEMLEQRDGVLNFVDEVRRAGFQHAVVLGMGGSSLCPDVCRATFGVAPGYLELHVLDSTVPANVVRVEKAIDLPRSLFVVSSKSGGTAETMSFFKYFHDRVAKIKGERAGENFIAITDPGTSLEKLAKEKGFRRVFAGKPDVGGRYSALSNFGMVPAALAGVEIAALLDRAERMVQACGGAVASRENPGISLGVVMAEAAVAGRDKVTLVTSPTVAAFADWAEQLIAESTGKEGKGLIPVAGETLGDPADYGDDRLFISLSLASDPCDATEGKLKALEAAGHPVVRIALGDKMDLGQEFFRWEIATATAGALLGINAFDQPNVQESKDHTNRLLADFKTHGKLPAPAPLLESDGLALYCDPATRARAEQSGQASTDSAEGLIAAFLGEASPGDYISLMAYVERSEPVERVLQAVRTRLRDSLRLATTVGYGPRFLHSTGQLHKGGPNRGLFFQLTDDDSIGLPIPGEPYTFSILKQAQALGDMQSLEGKQRRVIRVHLAKGALAGLNSLAKVLDGALAKVRAKAA
jgi:transaldolase/glucose-6-phosphate isomerase